MKKMLNILMLIGFGFAFCLSTYGQTYVDIKVTPPTDNACITSVRSLTDNASFAIIPNPNNGLFKLEYSGVNPNEKFDIVITNALGTVVYQQKYRTLLKDEQIIDISGLPKNMYILTLRGIQICTSKKFIVK
jgi:hypothetical protein